MLTNYARIGKTENISWRNVNAIVCGRYVQILEQILMKLERVIIDSVGIQTIANNYIDFGTQLNVTIDMTQVWIFVGMDFK